MPDYLSQFRQQIQLDYSPKSISISRQNLGTPYSGQVCMHEQHSVPSTTVSLDPTTSGGGCLFSNRDSAEETISSKRTLPSSPSYSKQTVDQYQAYFTIIAPLFRSSPIFFETDQQINHVSIRS
ncbi:hypothetical protein RRG08_063538 [Elysia crispata]|uniref:Uncharacterized protein n=1 Tax=Elysia crispata TaxID=231223 RepID=A0AAE1EGU6_9GAST|nr:hypothetical protein RRG08_063538 [Elysia crispata]